MSIQLEVPHLDHSGAEAKGSIWDQEISNFYIDKYEQLEEFSDWIPSDLIIKNSFYIARNTCICPDCYKQTPVIAIASEQYLTTDYSDLGIKAVEWKQEKQLTLFTEISYLPSNINSMIVEQFPYYKRIHSEITKEIYWSNTCVHCGELQCDWLNHNTPDGAFFPCNEDDAKKIELSRIMVKHDFSIVANFNVNGSAEMIKKYSAIT